MPMDNLRDLFRHELMDIYDAEHRFRDALGKMSEDVRTPELRKGFEAHREQTETQIERLDKIFRAMDAEPKRAECAGAKGLIEERTMFLKDKPSKEVLEIFSVGAALKTEHYEIVAYESLISLAEQLDMPDAVELLEENLAEEEGMAEKLKEMEKKPLQSAR